ncbi:unnamed protein product [Hermetia illucens]|uniref:J domain-containing protein n=1 Tax=Hermetia illucens TaxID=343691 RepID=A0A7R8UCW7_HERIL|nr:unnamed protein product [Hermetia illucens]
MPLTLDLCEKFFGTRDIYALFELKKDSSEDDMKKAYYKLSLKVHPDRVPDAQKEEAAERFKVVARIYRVLTNKNEKALYDEKQIMDDNDDEVRFANTLWLAQHVWRVVEVVFIPKCETPTYIDTKLFRIAGIYGGLWRTLEILKKMMFRKSVRR